MIAGRIDDDHEQEQDHKKDSRVGVVGDQGGLNERRAERQSKSSSMRRVSSAETEVRKRGVLLTRIPPERV